MAFNLLLPEARKYGAHVGQMGVKIVWVVDNDVVNVGAREFTLGAQSVIHEPLEKCGRVLEPKWQHNPFVQAIMSPKCCFTAVLLGNSHLVVTPSQIQSGK